MLRFVNWHRNHRHLDENDNGSRCRLEDITRVKKIRKKYKMLVFVVFGVVEKDMVYREDNSKRNKTV